MKLWPILAALFGPGVAQALVGRRKIAIAFAVAFALAVFALAFTIHGIAIAGAIWIVSVLDTIVYVARTPAVARDRTHEAALVWAALVVVAGVTKLFLAEAFKFPSSSMSPTLLIGDHVFISKLGTISRGDVIVFAQPCQQRDYGKRVIALANDTIEIRCNILYVNGKAVPEKLVKAADTYQERDEMDGASFTREVSRYQQTLDGTTFEIFDRADRPEHGNIADDKDFPLDTNPTCATQAYDSEPNPDQRPGKIVETKPGAAACEQQRHYVVPPGHVFVMGDHRNNSNDSRYWGPVPAGNIKGRAIGIWLPVARFGAL